MKMKMKIKRFLKFFGGIIGGCFLFFLFVIGMYFLLFLEIVKEVIKLFERKKISNNDDITVKRLYQ